MGKDDSDKLVEAGGKSPLHLAALVLIVGGGTAALLGGAQEIIRLAGLALVLIAGVTLVILAIVDQYFRQSRPKPMEEEALTEAEAADIDPTDHATSSSDSDAVSNTDDEVASSTVKQKNQATIEVSGRNNKVQVNQKNNHSGPKAVGCLTFNIQIIVGGCSVLAAIIFAYPMFAQAREAAHKAPTLAAFKQIAVGMLVYTTDFDETLPLATAWEDSLSPYIKSGAVGLVGEANFSKAFNQPLGGLSLSAVELPQEVGMIFESTKTERNATDNFESVRYSQRESGLFCFVAYVDGHSKPIRQNSPVGDSDLNGPLAASRFR